ncbi:hypothetical protein WJX74_006667 [Apatococcus lobatus]|uniref:Farnesyl diphosphate synthase n=1 Tax=Apatococcus lobatus TaxID=904363 RepID=A0AAW1RVM4_9CHLO
MATSQAQHLNGSAPKTASAPLQAKKDFLKVFDQLRGEILDDPLLAGQPDYAHGWLAKMLNYNVPGGKLNRGMAVADVLSALRGDKECTREEKLSADILGWCIELLQAFFLVADDVMDQSVTRRGQPCWFRLPEVGLIATNDSIVLEGCIYRILQRHFRSSPSYGQILELFHETTFQTSHGQMLDLTTTPPGKVDLARYTVPTYMRIVTFKTAYYSFYLPVACGLIIGGKSDDKDLDVAKEICLQMGQYFQIQDDYLDAYAPPEVLGKVGTDIQDSKCSWLIVQALQRANAGQRSIIEDNYGKDNADNIGKIKEVYRQLRLDEVFQKYESESYHSLTSLIQKQNQLPEDVFMLLLNKIYKRSK